MKSPPSSVITFAPLLIAVVALAVGWIGRGLFALCRTASQATAPPTAEISRAGSSSAASLKSQHSGGVSTEEPKPVAKRLLQAVLEGTQEEASETLLKLRFPQALAGCDEAALAEMLESVMRYVKDWPDIYSSIGPLPRQLTDLVMAQMAALNPRKALDFQLGLAQAGMPIGEESSSMVMALLAKQNAPDVQNVIESLPPGDIRASAQIAWWTARSKNDAEGVFQSLMNLDAHARDSLSSFPSPLRELLGTLALQAPEKALQAAALLPWDPYDSAQTDVVRAWINRDPKAAVQWALEQNDAKSLKMCLEALPSESRAMDEKSLRDNFSSITSQDPAERAALASALAARLAEQDLPESVRWTATLPEDAREQAKVPVAKAWIKQDVSAAAEWLTTWPAGSAKDGAVEELTNAIVEDDPESALTWAASIQTKRRFNLMQNALDTLAGKDPAAAERAMQTLSVEDRAVLSVMKRTGLGE